MDVSVAKPVAGRANAYTIVNEFSGKCLDVNGASTADGAAVIQWTCSGSTNQMFTLNPVAGNSKDYQLAAVHSGKCVDVSGISTTPRAVIHQRTCVALTWLRSVSISELSAGAVKLAPGATISMSLDCRYSMVVVAPPTCSDQSSVGGLYEPPPHSAGMSAPPPSRIALWPWSVNSGPSGPFFQVSPSGTGAPEDRERTHERGPGSWRSPGLV
ncbi:RICIN domain-containing protein [Promicromonospora soli]